MTNIRLEAEDMNLFNYQVESGKSPASGNQLINLLQLRGTAEKQGTASQTFTGATGYYDVKVGFFDENDGKGQISIQIGSAQEQWTLDQNLGNGAVTNKNKVERTIFTGLEISNGENITITGTAESGEWARVDYVEFIPVGAGVLSLSNDSYSVNEDGTQAAVTVTRSNGSIGAVSVTLTPSNGTATAPDDYDNSTIEVNFADGETEKTVNIPIADDTDTEGDETINLALSDPTGGATIGTQDTAVLTVVDDEVQSSSSFRLEAEDMILSGYISESRNIASGDAVVSLLNSDNTQGSATTQFTGATATYDVVVGYYDESDGKSPVSVEIGNDTVDSWVFDQNLGHGAVSSRNFVERTIATSLQINNGENITLNGEQEAGEWARFDYIEFIPVTVPTLEPELGTLSFSDTTYSINEDGTTTAAVTVTRSGGSDGAVSVTLTPSNGTATADDYDNTPITVDFADGETEKTVNISITDDTETEADETINLALSNPTGGATLGTQDTAVLTIVDNEIPPFDEIHGTEAGETLTGDAQNNNINGFGGDDTLNGGGGDDNLFGGSGNNTYNGNSGNDTVSYANNQTSGVIANLDTGNVSRKFETWSEDLKIMPLGDSNTKGVGNQYVAGYRTKLWRYLNGAGYNLDFVGTAYSGPSDIDRDHEGRGAFTINHLIDNTVTQFQGYNSPSVATYTTIEDTLGTHNPNMVLLMAGTNDIREGDDADTVLNELEALVDRIVTHSPDTHVLVASLIPNTVNTTRETKTIEVSGRIDSEVVQPLANAGNNVSFVDIFNAPLIASDFHSDGIHLTSSGYDGLAEVWEDAILNTVVAEDTLISVENLIGSDGNDELTGNNAANELTGGAGDDTLTGGGGDDLFIYNEGDGTDVITDFGVGNDLFGLSGGLTFNKLTIETAGLNTEVKVTNTNEVLAVLEGVVANNITSADFITV